MMRTTSRTTTHAAGPTLPAPEATASPKAVSTPEVGLGPSPVVPKAPPTALSKMSQAVRAALGLSTAGGGRGSSPVGPVQAAMIGAALVLSGCATGPAPTLQAPSFPSAVQRTVEGVKVRLAPANATPAERYAHYAEIVRALGGKMRAGEPYVLAIRGLDRGGSKDVNVHPYLRDTIVVLSIGANGPTAVEMPGSTYPGVKAPTKGPDVNRDGKSDVGMVREGNYRAHANGDFLGEPSFHVRRTNGSGRLPGVRDTNQDGIFSEAEWTSSVNGGDGLTAVLFHTSFERDGDRPLVNSRGCFNVYPIDDFVAAVGGKGANFNVSLVDATGAEPGGFVR